MDYRPAIHADWAAIGEYIASKDYFMPIDPAQLGGSWLLAIQDNKIRGTIWTFTAQGNAFIDYWTADTPQIAAHLGAFMYHNLQLNGIKYVRAMIKTDNLVAQRMATKIFGMGIVDNYSMAFRSI